MCWETSKKSVCKFRKIAKKDIEVFKIVVEQNNNEFRPYFMSSKLCYKLGNEYKTKIEKRKNTARCYDKIQIDAGFHSYDLKLVRPYKDFYHELDDNITPYFGAFSLVNGCSIGIYTCNDGLHFTNPAFVKCIVPKGAKYYENEVGEIVSNRIKIVGVIPLDDVIIFLEGSK